MTSNKELGYYWVVYKCINCGTELQKRIPYGKPIPVLVDEGDVGEERDNIAPECEYCGCRFYTRGRPVSNP